jgi:hypothetical protein
MYEEYPKMLYRSGGPQSEAYFGHRMDTLIVQSRTEEQAAARKGWRPHQQAIEQCVRRKKLERVKAFYIEHWKWLWTTAIAIALGTFLKK